ncbi:MAG: NAD(P)H-hydrate dehydratase [Sutterella wadsworthensis]|nr:NAD(P)H-hydrate dehydratase [Sutterella wadsworthensis]
MSLTILTADELQNLEMRAANQLGTDTLMKRAGAAAAELIMKRLEDAGVEQRRVTLLVGPGNNGGDALACACELREKGAVVNVVLPGGRRPTSALALAQLERWTQAGGTTYDDPYMTEKADCVVDGLFGTGLAKPITGDYLDAVLWFNERQALKVSLDIPSGLNPVTGHWTGSYPGCSADVTITFLCVKSGLYMCEGADAAGEIVLNELDVSVPLSPLSVIGTDEFPRVLRPRVKNSHKGDYGSVAVIGGTDGMIGASILAARAALISGAGRVTLECRAEHAPHVDMVYPEIMFATKPVNLEDFDAIVLGCGLGTSAEAKARVIEALNCQKPLILDADALNIIAADIKLQDMVLARRAPTVLTPHPGEAARLLRRDTAGVTADRVAACRELAVQTGAIVVLKGAGTVISMRSSRTWINPTGSPMLATGGSGDVLAGMIGAMFAQGYDMVESVLAAVYFHGLSAEGLEAGFTAGEIAPNAMALVHDARVSYDL